jgi:hypothetical protein
VKRILKNRLKKDYRRCPIYEDENAIPYPEDMKIEMFSGETIHGYLLEQRPLPIKVTYINGSFNMTVNNYKTVKKLKEKICKLYGLGSDVVITDEEERSYNQNIIFEYLTNEIWLCIQNSRTLIKAELKKIEYEIMKGDSYQNFYAVIFSAWNRAALMNYINILISERNRNVELYVDGNIWRTDEVAINVVNARVKVLTRKRNLNGKSYLWVASKEELEIWSLKIRCGNYNRYFTV